jgi:hypothetical protein
VEDHVELVGIAKCGVRLRCSAASYADPSGMMRMGMHYSLNGDALITLSWTRLLAWGGVGVVVVSVVILHKTDLACGYCIRPHVKPYT